MGKCRKIAGIDHDQVAGEAYESIDAPTQQLTTLEIGTVGLRHEGHRHISSAGVVIGARVRHRCSRILMASVRFRNGGPGTVLNRPGHQMCRQVSRPQPSGLKRRADGAVDLATMATQLVTTLVTDSAASHACQRRPASRARGAPPYGRVRRLETTSDVHEPGGSPGLALGASGGGHRSFGASLGEAGAATAPTWRMIACAFRPNEYLWWACDVELHAARGRRGVMEAAGADGLSGNVVRGRE